MHSVSNKLMQGKIYIKANVPSQLEYESPSLAFKINVASWKMLMQKEENVTKADR